MGDRIWAGLKTCAALIFCGTLILIGVVIVFGLARELDCGYNCG